MRRITTSEKVPDDAVHVIGMMGAESVGDHTVDASWLATAGFEGSPGETLLAVTEAGTRLFVGLGDTIDAAALRLGAGAAARAVPPASTLATSLHLLDIEGAQESVVAGLMAGAYRFERYRSAPSTSSGDIVLVGEVDQPSLDRSILVATGVETARDWVNTAPAEGAPADLADEMAERLAAAGYEVEVWDETRATKERLGGLLGVAAGSDRPPRMIVARRRPIDGPRHLALVGKGIVFDSGGLSIKTAENMMRMKGDMAGAAAVVAAAEVVARLEVEISVSVYVPLTDNMPGGSALKPGDVITARNGKTIEVLNTDAEGRLVLADALSLAVEEAPDLVVDVATLTGASRVALGDHIAALFACDETAAETVAAAADAAGERIWRMPLPPDYRQLIESAVADMKNTGGAYGGAIAAALLLSEFAGEHPWAHLDIAGPSWLHDDGPLGPKGGSGFGVATLVTLAERMSRP